MNWPLGPAESALPASSDPRWSLCDHFFHELEPWVKDHGLSLSRQTVAGLYSISSNHRVHVYFNLQDNHLFVITPAGYKMESLVFPESNPQAAIWAFKEANLEMLARIALESI